MHDKTRAHGGADARIVAMFAAYPDISQEDERELIQWYRKEASALDVGLIASDPDLKPGLDRFRARHVNRFTFTDILMAAAFVAIFLGFAALLLVLKG